MAASRRRRWASPLLLGAVLLVATVGLSAASTPDAALPTDVLSVDAPLDAAAAAKLPWCSQHVVYRDTKGNGFGAQFMRVVDLLALANRINGTLHVAVQHWWNYGCGTSRTWSCYFRPPMPYCREKEGGEAVEVQKMDAIPAECEDFEPEEHHIEAVLHAPGSAEYERSPPRIPSCVSTRTARSEVRLNKELRSMLGVRDITPWRRLARTLWRPHDAMLARIEGTVRRMGLDRTKYIAVHVRRGDKASEATLQPASLYAKAVMALSGGGIRTVFVASDDFQAVRDMRRELPGFAVFSLSLDNHGHVQGSHNDIQLMQRYEGTCRLVAEAHILSGGEFFIGTLSSNLGRLVHMLREQPASTTISLDDLWSPGNAWRDFKTSYCWANNTAANSLWCSVSDSMFY